MARICEKACDSMQEKQEALEDALMLLSHVKLLVNSTAAGNKPEDIVNILTNWLEEFNANRDIMSNRMISLGIRYYYTRREQTRRLAEIFDRIAI